MAAERLRLTPDAEAQLAACVHCGFCLPVCPTYTELGSEADSPRGRLWLMAAAAEGSLDAAAADLRRHLDLCLDCRACETACPSGVRYGAVLESARATLFRGGLAWRAVMRGLWRQPRRLAALARLLRLAQRLGLTRLARELAGVPPALGEMAESLPPVPPQPSRRTLPPRIAARGQATGVAAAFLGCVQDVLFPADNHAMAGVLAAGGLEVSVPPGQVCCGALHQHAGDLAGARELARRNVLAFAGADGPVAVNAAGCGALLKHYDRLLPGDVAAAAFAARVRDFSELAAGLRLPEPRPLGPVRVVYQDPCHLAHGQGIRRPPRALLAAVPGLEVVEIEEAESCCGSAGLYNLSQWAMSRAVLDRKLAFVAAARPDWLVTANPGCALQLRYGVRRAGLEVRVRSLCAVLAEAYVPEAYVPEPYLPEAPVRTPPGRGRP